jgi:hypothetical protein
MECLPRVLESSFDFFFFLVLSSKRCVFDQLLFLSSVFYVRSGTQLQ